MKGNKIRNGCLTPAFSGAQNTVEMLCHPYILVDCESLTPTQGATQQSVDSEIVPVSPIALEGWGPKEGGNATSPLHSRGSPTKGTKSEVKTYTRGHHDAPSISKYGSLVQLDAQIAALR